MFYRWDHVLQQYIKSKTFDQLSWSSQSFAWRMTIVCKICDTPEKPANPKTQPGVVSRGPETGPCRAQDGLATGRSDEGWHQATVAACRHRQNAYPACLLAHAGTGRQKGGMPTLACPRLSAWHAGPSAPANRGLSNNSGGTLRSRVILIGFEQSSEIRHNNTNDF